MLGRSVLNLSLALALAGGLTMASPALAQGKSKKHEKKEKTRVEQVRYDQRRPDLQRRNTGKSVPPGWCIGKGNPHNTPENCGYNNGNRRDVRYDRRDDRRYDDRYDRRTSGRYGQYATFAAYSRAHDSFHRSHDRQCRERAGRRPLDPTWQLRVRAECKAEHDRWHDRAGVRHDGSVIYASRR